MITICTHTDGPAHSCGYVDDRNRLIEEAERLAFQRSHPMGGSLHSPIAWNREFFAAMDELARERGLVGGGRRLLLARAA